jgi:DNA-binding LytR/AlgR family response regulator
MSMISCLIIDDEPLALELLESYISRIPYLKLVGKCQSALEALDIMNTVKIDLLFLDIQMPELSGIELSRVVGNDVRIVFTSAYSSYAVEGFKVNAIDYLLKPFDFDAFRRSSHKAKEWFDIKNPVLQGKPDESENIIFIKSGYKQVKIDLVNVYCFEGLKDYVKIWIAGKHEPLMTLMSLKALEESLPPGRFMRIHRSFIISLDKIRLVERNKVQLTNNISVTISDPYREEFNHFLTGISLS